MIRLHWHDCAGRSRRLELSATSMWWDVTDLRWWHVTGSGNPWHPGTWARLRADLRS